MKTVSHSFWMMPAAVAICLVVASVSVWAQAPTGRIYDPGKLKPTDSTPTLKVGDTAPDFELPSISGDKVSLQQFRGTKNIAISFVPAAWTPVCSQQWPGYNIAEEIFQKHDTVLLGITVDSVPSLYAWTKDMGKLWFPVLSDFWPHGEVARKYGVLRSDGVSERALFIIDKQGVVRHIDIYDINKLPRLEHLVQALEKVKSSRGRQ